MEGFYVELAKLFPHLSANLLSGIYVFARLLGFFRMAPIFNRKEMPAMVKLALALMFTFLLTAFISPKLPVIQNAEDSMLLSIVLSDLINLFRLSGILIVWKSSTLASL
jgi:flagellar biosynthesis protein FliR